MSTGFSFPWEKAAMRGEELPDGLSLPDQMAYTALRNTYRAYYDKTISRDAAAAEKQRIRLAWERAVSRAAFDQRLTRDLGLKERPVRADPTGRVAAGAMNNTRFSPTASATETATP